MRGPKFLPEQRRRQLYQEISRFPLTVSEKDVALYSQYARLDARLAEVLTEHLRDFWWKHSPSSLNNRLKAQPWPSAIKPPIFQILQYCESEAENKKQFISWMEEVIRGIANTRPQLYFFPTFKPRAKALDREVDEAIDAYTRAGYHAKDLLFNKGKPGRLGSFQAEVEKPGNSDRAFKFRLLMQLRELLSKNRNLKADRTTLSQIRSGKIEGLSVERLAKIFDRSN